MSPHRAHRIADQGIETMRVYPLFYIGFLKAGSETGYELVWEVILGGIVKRVEK